MHRPAKLQRVSSRTSSRCQSIRPLWNDPAISLLCHAIPRWSDVGSWHALWEILEKDGAGNGIQGDGLVVDGANNLIKAESRLVALAGVSNLAVIETADAILVADRTQSEAVKAVVGRLNDGSRAEAQSPSQTTV